MEPVYVVVEEVTHLVGAFLEKAREQKQFESINSVNV